MACFDDSERGSMTDGHKVDLRESNVSRNMGYGLHRATTGLFSDPNASGGGPALDCTILGTL